MNILLFLSSLVCSADTGKTDCWPGFRGDGTSRTAARNLPLRWSGKENVAWKASLPGYGQSSPVVWQDRVFVTAVAGPEKDKCLVVALETATGKQLWQKEFTASQKGKNNPIMSRAAPTPVVDAQGLYVFFETGDLIGLSHSGEVKWQRSLVKAYGAFENMHGLASSLAQTDRAVVVLIDHRGPSYLLAVDKATGKNLWKTGRASRSSWATPVAATVHGRPLIVVSSGGAVTAYDAANGKQLWELDGLVGNNVPSATVAGDLVVIGAGLNRMKPDPVASARSNCCLRLTRKGDTLGHEVIWQAKKALSQHASPLIHHGQAYILTKVGLVHCFDVQTGKECYAERLDDPCWATPIGAGEHVYFFGKEGTTTVLRAGPAFVKVASNRLWSDGDLKTRREADALKPENKLPPRPAKEGRPAGTEQMGFDALGQVVYGVAAVDNAFFLRTGTELICIRQAMAR